MVETFVYFVYRQDFIDSTYTETFLQSPDTKKLLFLSQVYSADKSVTLDYEDFVFVCEHKQ